MDSAVSARPMSWNTNETSNQAEMALISISVGSYSVTVRQQTGMQTMYTLQNKQKTEDMGTEKETSGKWYFSQRTLLVCRYGSFTLTLADYHGINKHIHTPRTKSEMIIVKVWVSLLVVFFTRYIRRHRRLGHPERKGSQWAGGDGGLPSWTYHTSPREAHDNLPGG